MLILITSLFLTLNPYLEDPETEDLIHQLVTGFINITYIEDNQWYDCGIPTRGKKDWYIRADYMARVLLHEMEHQKLNVSIWGVWGVIWNESRGNRCSIGPNPRNYAYKTGIVEEKLNPHLWTEEMIHTTLNDPNWNNQLADLGLCQVVWKRYSRIPIPEGERVPTIEEAISIEDGLKICVHTMKARQVWARQGSMKTICGIKGNKRSKLRAYFSRMPWIFWPGIKARFDYLHKIARIVRRMKGPYQEVLGQ